MMSDIEEKVMVKPVTHSSPSQTTMNDPCPPEQEFKRLSALTELALDAPDCNHAKVEHLKKEIASGEYQTNNYDIAMRMLLHF